MKKKLVANQIELEISQGSCHLKNLELNNDVRLGPKERFQATHPFQQTINNLLGDLPFSLKSGTIAHAWVTIPAMKNIDNCKLELEGVHITLTPKKAGQCARSNLTNFINFVIL